MQWTKIVRNTVLEELTFTMQLVPSCLCTEFRTKVELVMLTFAMFKAESAADVCALLLSQLQSRKFSFLLSIKETAPPELLAPLLRHEQFKKLWFACK